MSKRYVIVPRRKGKYIIPVIEERVFNSPMRFGSYCAEDGTLWTSLNDGVHIFEDQILAKNKLTEVIEQLFKH